MQTYIALIADRSGRYAHVYGTADTWDNLCNQLEDIGCEVVENQTQDWEGCSTDEIAEDCWSIQQLLTKTDFIAH
jgi:hypothetical protein